jgi:hypothetical protein
MERDTAPLPLAHAHVPLAEPLPMNLPPGKRRFWNKRRIIGLVVAIVVIALSCCVYVGFSIWSGISGAIQTQNEIKPLTEEAYPGYHMLDSTISGHIMESDEHPTLRIDIRYFEVGTLAPWAYQAVEPVSDEWMTTETFFRHALGQPKDPRTNMNYDVSGFVEAYGPLKPGSNAVVSGVWFDRMTPEGLESYGVLVARRNDGENMWPDHYAAFSRDPETGAWLGEPFYAVDVGRAEATGAREENVCRQNQDLIHNAALMFTIDSGDAPTKIDDLVPSYRSELPVCLSGGSYEYQADSSTVSCSIHGAPRLDE